MDASSSLESSDLGGGALLESSAFAVVAIDRGGKVRFWNSGAERIFGWTESEVIGRDLPVILPDQRDLFRELRERVLAGEALDGIHMRHGRKDGSTVDLVLSVRAVRAGDESRITILALARERSEERDVEALSRQIRRLENRLAEVQLSPHFLFNSLHAIGVLLRRSENEQAMRLLTHLSDILRRSLRGDRGEEVTLEEEVDVLRKYVEVERTRFGDRVRVDIEVAPGARAALVPSLLLQPLVENAIRHGVAPRADGGRVEVVGERRRGRLCLRVTDDGVGLPNGWTLRRDAGVGLRAVLARLCSFHPSGILEVSPRQEGGVEAAVELPFRAG